MPNSRQDSGQPPHESVGAPPLPASHEGPGDEAVRKQIDDSEEDAAEAGRDPHPAP